MQASCHCGNIRFTTPTEKPLSLWKCHCIDCQKQAASAFGMSAIFPRFDPPQHPDLGKWCRPTASDNTLECFFCKNCGSRFIHQTVGGKTTTVKGGALDARHELDWDAAPHIWTQNAIISIPKGSETHPREPDAASIARHMQPQQS